MSPNCINTLFSLGIQIISHGPLNSVLLLSPLTSPLISYSLSVEFAILQEMNNRIGPRGKLERFCGSTICEQCKTAVSKPVWADTGCSSPESYRTPRFEYRFFFLSLSHTLTHTHEHPPTSTRTHAQPTSELFPLICHPN